jgi:hypothetical protein
MGAYHQDHEGSDSEAGHARRAEPARLKPVYPPGARDWQSTKVMRLSWKGGETIAEKDCQMTFVH